MATVNRDSAKDETILAKTGKPREAWFKIIDSFDCQVKGHKATAQHLKETYGLNEWYAQGLTVDYERAHGIREVGQRCGGKFAVSVTRTIAAPVERVWQAWADALLLSEWFASKASHDFREGGVYDNGDGDKGRYKRIVPNKRLSFTWENEKHSPGSAVIVEFNGKGDKTTVVVTHDKLPDKTGCEDMKKSWTWALTSLKSYLETGNPVRYEDWDKGA